MTEALHPVLTSFFAAAQPEDHELLRQLQTTRSLADGQELFRAGAAADALYLVLEGRFAVHKTTGLRGSRAQVVALLETGTVIGEGVLAEGRVRHSTVVAVEDSLVAVFSEGALSELEQRAPQLFSGFVKKVLSLISLRLQKSSDRLALIL